FLTTATDWYFLNSPTFLWHIGTRDFLFLIFYNKCSFEIEIYQKHNCIKTSHFLTTSIKTKLILKICDKTRIALKPKNYFFLTFGLFIYLIVFLLKIFQMIGILLKFDSLISFCSNYFCYNCCVAGGIILHRYDTLVIMEEYSAVISLVFVPLLHFYKMQISMSYQKI
ncbi:hypothetical protein RFI_36785, partial [Reticulomyxa filosa]